MLPPVTMRRQLFAAATTLLLVLSPYAIGIGQTPPSQSSPGWQAMGRSVVPTTVPRPVEGQQPERKWNTQRQGADAEPVSGFVESLKGNDAIIKLVVGQARLLTTKAPIVRKGDVAVIAVGDPSVTDFEVLPDPRMIRITGKRAGVTDLTFVTSDGQTYIFEVHVLYDLELLHARIRHAFPHALVKMSQMRDHLVLEGQARSMRQTVMIENTIRAFLSSVQASSLVSGTQTKAAEEDDPTERAAGVNGENGKDDRSLQLRAGTERTSRPDASGPSAAPQIINLLSVPGVQQVLLQVRIAELDRTGLREIGVDSFFEFGSGTLLGTQIAGSTVSLNGLTPGTSTTGFGVFPNGRVEIMLKALRENSLLHILAEPNLVSLTGHEASFLAGGEFPVPVPQGSGIGTSGNVTVQFKKFGVQLNFVPHILDDASIRLEIRSEVSTIDESLGTTLVVGGDPIPGINTRRVQTTVMLREGETLALAGLLQVTLDASTKRIPGLGDLPYLGPFFSNTTHKRVEKELLVLVTPYLVSPLDPDEIPLLPGEEIQDPNDLEFYLLNRIEGRTGREYRSTTSWDDPLGLVRLMKLERDNVSGPIGFSN